ncbi:hypothetical protein COLO4_13248 [Corchorus olitorius]|uniref:Uncharacterized protein n=1 Tax=Corchorus olitorius TaxID=93759 RepID=A0A1R3JXA7_9ROSI|nr:hypothetical protein COLO4_13248 [Corchorus olitorius]
MVVKKGVSIRREREVSLLCVVVCIVSKNGIRIQLASR